MYGHSLLIGEEGIAISDDEIEMRIKMPPSRKLEFAASIVKFFADKEMEEDQEPTEDSEESNDYFT